MGLKGLTPEQKKFYDDNGYILLRDILTKEEVEEMLNEYDNLFKRKNQEIMENSWVGGRADDLRITDSPYTVKGVHNLQQHHAAFSQFLHNDKLLDCLEDIMETKNIMLHHTKAHYKPPSNGACYPTHQDYPYFPFEDAKANVAAFVHLDDSNPENGGLHVYPGSHKNGPLEEDPAAKLTDYHFVDQKKYPLSKATPVLAKRGDVVIFSYLLIHGSTLNTSTRPRRMFLAQFISPDNRPIGEQRIQPGYGWMLRGVNVHKDESVAERFSFT